MSDIITFEEFYKLIQEEVKAGRVTEFYHKNYPELRGYNYTEKVKFDKAWNNINRLCRGLVFQVEPEIKLLNNPIPAILNFEETDYTLLSLENEVEYIEEKEDGSCIIAFRWDNSPLPYDDDTLIVMTRGSFHSEQALAAYKIFAEQGAYSNLLSENYGNTLIFELVGPSNKNVCRTKYQKDELILLDIRPDRSIGEFFSWNAKEWSNWEKNHKYIKRPKRYELNQELYSFVVHNTDPNFEGVVLTLKNGIKIKMKSDRYKMLHRVLTGKFTESRKLDLWLAFREDRLNEQLNDIPDEFFSEIKDHINEVENSYKTFKENIIKNYDIMYNRYKNEQKTRKDIALEFKNYQFLLSFVFSEQLNEEDIIKFFTKSFT